MDKPFRIDEESSNEQHLFVDIPDRHMTVDISITDEGVVIDIWPIDEPHADGSIASTYAFTSEAHGSEMTYVPIQTVDGKPTFIPAPNLGEQEDV